MTKGVSLLFCLFFLFQNGFSQKDFFKNHTFTQADTLRGMLRPERTCFDVTYYILDIEINPGKKYIEGYADIFFDVKEDFKTLQIDLFKNMKINQISNYDSELKYYRIHNAVFVEMPENQPTGTSNSIRVFYEGIPTEAENAPWDGGFVWKKDSFGKDWIGVACEGTGASLWWPNKDHLSDEPDSMEINITVPDSLVCISNGNLRKTESADGKKKFHWFVSYPINNYTVTVNIADYAQFSDPYVSSDGDTLQVDYYVLKENLEKAIPHFKQTNDILKCYEHYFGKYPFWNDGLAFVETPYLGMEHQSAIAYGNKYMRGYLGRMIPRDMNWDYIIVHELGHEWFGNSVSSNDHAEMWIHESFTTYMEALWVECSMGYEAAIRYLESQKLFIANREPILGPLNVNFDGWSRSDHYYKGSRVLHTLRHALNNDDLWFEILKGFYQKYKISHCTTQDFTDYVNEKTGRKWEGFFEQYLEYPGIPKLVYSLNETEAGLMIKYKWDADSEDFSMPILIGKDDKAVLIYPNAKEVQATMIPGMALSDFHVPIKQFYVKTKRLKWKD